MMTGGINFNPYNTSWQPYQNVQPRTFNPPLPTYHAEPIHGENAAWQFPMGPNSEIYLPDADEDLIWWIRTDANGNKVLNTSLDEIELEEHSVTMDNNKATDTKTGNIYKITNATGKSFWFGKFRHL